MVRNGEKACMVSILPGGSNWDVIGRSIGENLSRTLPAAVQQGYQRQQGLSAIDKLQNQLQEAGGDITKIMPALAKAYTLNPGLERSGLGPMFLQQAQRQAGAQQFPVGQGQPGSSEPKQVPLSVTDFVPPSSVGDPQSAGGFQLPYGPEAIAAIRQKARENKFLPEMEERFVNDALEFNKIAEQRRNAELSNYDQQQKERRDTLENQRLFRNYIVENAPEFTSNPDELELALKAGEKYQGEKSFADRLAKVKNELRPYQAAKKGLEKTLQRPLFGYTKDQLELARRRAQMMVDMNQKPQLQLMIANGGQGEVEEANLLNPLSNQMEKGLNSLPKFTNPFDVVKSIDVDSPEYQKQLSQGSERRLKQRENAVNYLAKAIEPGSDYNHPGTNLLLTRYHLMQKGQSWEEAGQTIDQAISQGNIKLDPQQKIDYQKLAYPPLTGDSYFDTVMNNLMFPITGKQ